MTNDKAKNQPETSISEFKREKKVHPRHTLTDMQCFIAHQDFNKYLRWSLYVREIHLCLKTQKVPVLSEVLSFGNKKEVSDSTCSMTLFIQSKCFPDTAENDAFFDAEKCCYCIPRGVFRDMDCLVDTSISILKEEFKRCMNWYKSEALKQSLVNSNGRVTKKKEKKRRKEKGDPIATKYSKEQTDILTYWIMENMVCLCCMYLAVSMIILKGCIIIFILQRTFYAIFLRAPQEWPFPKAEEIAKLMQECDLERSQVINWTTNVRKRNWKATVERTKKPHNFIDFMFLALDRDERIVKPAQAGVLDDDNVVDDKNDDDENSIVTVKIATRGKRARSTRSKSSHGSATKLSKKPKLPTNSNKKGEGQHHAKKSKKIKVKESENFEPLPINTPIEIPQLKQFAAKISPFHPEIPVPSTPSTSTSNGLLSEKVNADNGGEVVPDLPPLTQFDDDFNLHMISLDQGNSDDIMPSLSDFFLKGIYDRKIIGTCTENENEDDLLISVNVNVNPTMANIGEEMDDVDMLGLLEGGIDLTELKIGV